MLARRFKSALVPVSPQINIFLHIFISALTVQYCQHPSVSGPVLIEVFVFFNVYPVNINKQKKISRIS